MGGLVYISLKHAPYVVIQGIAARAAGWPNFFWPELREIGLAPILSPLGIVSKGASLLNMTQHHHSGKNFVVIPMGTSVMSEQSHLLFFL